MLIVFLVVVKECLFDLLYEIFIFVIEDNWLINLFFWLYKLLGSILFGLIVVIWVLRLFSWLRIELIWFVVLFRFFLILFWMLVNEVDI